MPIGEIFQQAGERIQRGVDAIRNTKINIDDNPFNDGKVGVSIQVGKNKVGVNIGTDIGNTLETGVSGPGQRAARNIGRGGARTAASARSLRNLIEVGVTGEREGVGSATISAGLGTKIIPGLDIKDANGRTVVSSDPLDVLGQKIQDGINIGGDIWAERERARHEGTIKAYEEEKNRNRRPPQPGSQSRDSVLRPSGTQPGTTSNRGPTSQPASRPTSRPTSQPRSPSLPGGTAQTIPKFPEQGADEMAGADEISRQRSGGGRLAPEPFQIPTEVPRTNTRLPNKPQIGGSRPSSRSQSGGKRIGGSGGMALGPGRANNQSPSSSGGKRIVRPEDMDDLSPNSPTNKPRINQPTQNNEPRTPKRMLSPQEIGLFNCLNNDGGEACYKKFNQQKPSQNSGGSGSANIELEFGDPYIGMTG